MTLAIARTDDLATCLALRRRQRRPVTNFVSHSHRERKWRHW